MSTIGRILVFFGIGSFILNYMSMEFKLLMWIDNWGFRTGVLIRIGFIVLGVLLMLADYLIKRNKNVA